jgi:hypothetical protein
VGVPRADGLRNWKEEDHLLPPKVLLYLYGKKMFKVKNGKRVEVFVAEVISRYRT